VGATATLDPWLDQNNATVHGTVVDGETGAPVGQASVLLYLNSQYWPQQPASAVQATTAADGTYQLEAAAGTYDGLLALVIQLSPGALRVDSVQPIALEAGDSARSLTLPTFSVASAACPSTSCPADFVGAGWRPNQPVYVAFGSTQDPPAVTVQADKDGRFSQTVPVSAAGRGSQPTAWQGDSAKSPERLAQAPQALPLGPAQPSRPVLTPRASGLRVYLVPLGESFALDYQGLAGTYRQRFGLQISILPTVHLTQAELDPTTHQLVAEALSDRMRAAYPDLDRDPHAILIGLTEYDLRIAAVPSWDWAFANRTEGRFAVISSARMDPLNFGESPDSALLHTRVRKMLTKTVGQLYFGLPLSNNRRSVMYGNVLSLADLDAMGEDW
jgi:predicted Zn-dependent protease